MNRRHLLHCNTNSLEYTWKNTHRHIRIHMHTSHTMIVSPAVRKKVWFQCCLRYKHTHAYITHHDSQPGCQKKSLILVLFEVIILNVNNTKHRTLTVSQWCNRDLTKSSQSTQIAKQTKLSLSLSHTHKLHNWQSCTLVSLEVIQCWTDQIPPFQFSLPFSVAALLSAKLPWTPSQVSANPLPTNRGLVITISGKANSNHGAIPVSYTHLTLPTMSPV